MTALSSPDPKGATDHRSHDHDGCLACREEHYAQAKADPVAAVVLDALHKQDAATYNGVSGDMGQVALDAAAKIRGLLDD